jgi:hypothetical protein
MKFTIFPKWDNETFITVNKQVEDIFPYVMGKFETEKFEKAPQLDGLVGWQKPPGGFRANIKNVDVVQKGTLKLKFGAYFSIHNLVCENATFTYSRQMVKNPSGGKSETASGEADYITSPLYCDVTIQLKPATKYSDESIKNFVFGYHNKETLRKVNGALIRSLKEEAERLNKYESSGLLGSLL